jgi:hypothetical protein
MADSDIELRIYKVTDGRLTCDADARSLLEGALWKNPSWEESVQQLRSGGETGEQKTHIQCVPEPLKRGSEREGDCDNVLLSLNPLNISVWGEALNPESVLKKEIDTILLHRKLRRELDFDSDAREEVSQLLPLADDVSYDEQGRVHIGKNLFFERNVYPKAREALLLCARNSETLRIIQDAMNGEGETLVRQPRAGSQIEGLAPRKKNGLDIDLLWRPDTGYLGDDRIPRGPAIQLPKLLLRAEAYKEDPKKYGEAEERGWVFLEKLSPEDRKKHENVQRWKKEYSGKIKVYEQATCFMLDKSVPLADPEMHYPYETKSVISDEPTLPENIHKNDEQLKGDKKWKIEIGYTRGEDGKSTRSLILLEDTKNKNKEKIVCPMHAFCVLAGVLPPELEAAKRSGESVVLSGSHDPRNATFRIVNTSPEEPKRDRQRS